MDRLGNLPVTVFGISGNSDFLLKEKDLISRKIKSLHLKVIEEGGFKITGVSGAIPVPFRSRLAFHERGLEKKITELVDNNTILLTHPPPWGLLDKVLGFARAGSRLVRKLVDRRQPSLLICGHIHENTGIMTYQNTTIVNCSMYRGKKGALIELEKPGATPKARILTNPETD